MTDFAAWLSDCDMLAATGELLLTLPPIAKGGDRIFLYFPGDTIVVKIIKIEPHEGGKHEHRVEVEVEADRADELRERLTYQVMEKEKGDGN